LDETEIKNLTDPDYLVNRRASFGGPAPEAVSAQCELLSVQARELTSRRNKFLRGLDGARHRLEQAMLRYSGTQRSK
jgi:hypothetical protein